MGWAGWAWGQSIQLPSYPAGAPRTAWIKRTHHGRRLGLLRLHFCLTRPVCMFIAMVVWVAMRSVWCSNQIDGHPNPNASDGNGRGSEGSPMIDAARRRHSAVQAASQHTIAIDLDRTRSILEESGYLSVPKASKAGGCWARPLLPSSATEEGWLHPMCSARTPGRRGHRIDGWHHRAARHTTLLHIVNSFLPRSHRAPEREGSVCVSSIKEERASSSQGNRERGRPSSIRQCIVQDSRLVLSAGGRREGWTTSTTTMSSARASGART